MATTINPLDTLLAAASPRVGNTVLPSTVSVAGNVTGTLNGIPVQDVIDEAYAGGGTDNYFTTSTSDPTGGGDGDAHYNSTTNVMWFKIAGVWTKGGTVNASQITTGTLAAARIAASSITADKLSVSTLSAIAANLGTVNAGSITGSANLDIAGTGKFSGATAGFDGLNYAVVANNGGTSGRGGVLARGSSTVPGLTVYGVSGDYAAVIQNTGDAGVSISSYTDALELTVSSGNRAINQTNGTATLRSVTVASGTLACGTFTTSSTSTVANLSSDMVDGYHANSFCRRVFGNSGSADPSIGVLGLYSYVSGTSFAAGSPASNEIRLNSTSDERLKHNIKDCKHGLDLINKLIPREFSWNATPDVVNHGFIAQEVEKVDKVFVVYNNDVTLGVDQYGLLAVAIKAIQELTKRVECLENAK